MKDPLKGLEGSHGTDLLFLKATLSVPQRHFYSTSEKNLQGSTQVRGQRAQCALISDQKKTRQLFEGWAQH